jgi:hypothetical protein
MCEADSNLYMEFALALSGTILLYATKQYLAFQRAVFSVYMTSAMVILLHAAAFMY